MSKYNTNLASEFYVLSTLYRLGINAYLTLGNKKSVDIIINNPGQEIITVDVKGLAGRYDWPAANIKDFSKPNHYYVLLSYEGKIDDPQSMPSTWIIPAKEIKQFFKYYKKRTDVSRSKMLNNGNRFKDNWKFFQQTTN